MMAQATEHSEILSQKEESRPSDFSGGTSKFYQKLAGEPILLGRLAAPSVLQSEPANYDLCRNSVVSGSETKQR